jgi:hypothetical protein
MDDERYREILRKYKEKMARIPLTVKGRKCKICLEGYNCPHHRNPFYVPLDSPEPKRRTRQPSPERRGRGTPKPNPTPRPNPTPKPNPTPRPNPNPKYSSGFGSSPYVPESPSKHKSSPGKGFGSSSPNPNFGIVKGDYIILKVVSPSKYGHHKGFYKVLSIDYTQNIANLRDPYNGTSFKEPINNLYYPFGRQSEIKAEIKAAREEYKRMAKSLNF